MDPQSKHDSGGTTNNYRLGPPTPLGRGNESIISQRSGKEQLRVGGEERQMLVYIKRILKVP